MAHHAAIKPTNAQKPKRQPRQVHVPGQMSHRQILEVLTGVLAAFFTAILSSTIVANALPTIMSELHGSSTDLAWVITAALLANAATTPIWGKLSDLYSKKLLVQLSIIIFVAGSILAGASQDIPTLLTARVIQGVAMGGLTALAQAIIGSMIPPRERGRYSGYMGAVMAVATAGGPLLGGFIVDSPLGWRWTFYVCIPLAIIALIVLQVTLRLPHTKVKAKIDWIGATLLTAGVSLILIWVSFAGKPDYYEWISWQSAVMLGGGIAMLLIMLFVETKVSQPIIPLKIIRQRTTALAIVASVAVGIVMFSSSSYLGQYYQISRGETPTVAGLLMLPLIAGNLIGSVGSGQLISRFGRWKPYLLAGSIAMIAGLALTSTIDHQTPLPLIGFYTGVVGLGLGMVLQNLVLAVQNTVSAKEIGSASSSVAFFRSFGGAIGVSVLGTILANRVATLSSEQFAAMGAHLGGSAPAGSTLDLKDMPAPVAMVIRAAYGDATALIFFIALFAGIAAFLCVLFIKEVPLRKTVDLEPKVQTEREAAQLGAALSESAAGYSMVGSSTADDLSATTGALPLVTPREDYPDALSEPEGPTSVVEPSKVVGESALTQEEHSKADNLTQTLARTQLLLAQQQVQLSDAIATMVKLTEDQSHASARHVEVSQRLLEWEKRLEQWERRLEAERLRQADAAEYLARQARIQRYPHEADFAEPRSPEYLIEELREALRDGPLSR